MEKNQIKQSTLIYCSNSYSGSTSANYIQSINTALAFAKYYDKIEILVRGNSLAITKTNIAENINIFCLYGPRTKTGSVCFYIMTMLFLFFTKIKSLVGRYKVRSFNRNISAGLFSALFRYNSHLVELHTMPAATNKRIILLYKKFSKSKIVAITYSLKTDLCSLFGQELGDRTLVCPDAHNFGVDYLRRAELIREKDCIAEFRVAYIGSLFSYKGSDTLYSLSRLLDYKLDIYAKDLSSLPQDIRTASKTGFVSHDSIGDLLLQYDVGFVLLENTKTEEDVSKYTSPLKLFEFLAAGLLIFCTDCDVLREVVSDDEVVFVRNNPDEIISKLSYYKSNPEERKKLSLNAIKLARNYSYAKRSEQIAEFSFNN